MTPTLRLWFTAAGLIGLAAVALGAYGAHALKGLDDALVQRFDTAVRYHFVHGLALLAVLVLAMMGDTAALRVSRWAFLFGLLAFSGSLYLSSLTGGAFSTRLAPMGGMALMLGWLGLAVHPWLTPLGRG